MKGFTKTLALILACLLQVTGLVACHGGKKLIDGLDEAPSRQCTATTNKKWKEP